jgi:hypothetical protein
MDIQKAPPPGTRVPEGGAFAFALLEPTLSGRFGQVSRKSYYCGFDPTIVMRPATAGLTGWASCLR